MGKTVTEKIIGYLSLWALFGFFFAAWHKGMYRGKKQAIFWLTIYGPAAWIVCLYYCAKIGIMEIICKYLRTRGDNLRRENTELRMRMDGQNIKR